MRCDLPYAARVRAIRRFTVRTVLPAPIAALGDLASNLRWSWHPPTCDLFAALDPERWAASRYDPVALLGALSPEELDALASDPQFVARVSAAADDLHTYLTEPRWYQHLGDEVPKGIAYFSPEFGITAVLPQYSGGLGILAGDHLKSASDLGVPIIGVGLLYRHGYFKQSLSREGWQQETYPILDPNELPIALVREAEGTPASVTVGLPGGRTLTAHIWRAQVGRVPLLLLDSNVEQNDEAARAITDRLYGGGGEHRLQQEMLLGIGGVRALRVWSRLTGAPAPDVYHTNEGHAGFLGLERIRELVTEEGRTFDEALEVARAGTIFTTHTPVPAGIDRFGRDQMEAFFGGDNTEPGVPVERILALGAEDYPGGDPSVFNMAVMGLRLAQRANGVSRAPRRREPRDVRRPVAGVRPGRGADHARSRTACTPRPGSTGGSSSSARSTSARRSRARRAAGRASTGSPTRRSGPSAARCGSRSSRRPASGCGPRGSSVVRAPRSSVGSTASSTPTS